MAGYKLDEGRDDRARQPRPRRPAREGRRADGRADADEPVDARALRRGHRGGRARSSTARGALLYYDGANLNAVCGDLAARRHGLRHRPLSTCTRRSRSRTAAAARAAGRSRCATTLEPFLPRPPVVRDGDALPARPRPAEVDRQGARLRRARSASSSARTRTCARTGPALREMSEDAVLNANYLLARLQGRLRPAVRPALHARVRALGARR